VKGFKAPFSSESLKLNAISSPLRFAVTHMDLPGLRLHPLKGQMKGFWAVTVRANWRVIPF
jgi:mRNA-degrading endonuclease YafQ of YafQ-DinJ toxin-antitoxin module